MKPYEFQNEFREERIFLTISFVAMMMVLGGIYFVQHSHEILFIAAQAMENPKEVFASVISGIATH